MLIARFDGGCWPNPGGHAACACLVMREEEEVYRESRYLGYGSRMTNNVAEYEGLMMILKWIGREKIGERVHVVSDSQVVIRRMTGQAGGPPTGVCASLANDCRLAASFHGKILSFEWQRRSENEECDAMCDLEIEEAEKSDIAP